MTEKYTLADRFTSSFLMVTSFGNLAGSVDRVFLAVDPQLLQQVGDLSGLEVGDLKIPNLSEIMK